MHSIMRWLILCLVSSPLLAASPDGVVSASHPAAAAAGARILEEGGNAVDAAAAMQFALNVVEPQSSGIGGGAFMLVHLARTGETFVVDSRERAPAAASADMFVSNGEAMAFPFASTSGLAVGVPGTVRGVDTALRRWGTKTLADTLAPAIELAEHGFRVNRFLAADIAADDGRTQLHPETAAIFRPGGVPLAEGDWLVQRDLAKTLRLIATKGQDAFYHGPLARAIVTAQQHTRSELGEAGKGRMTLDDLADYQAAVREPLIGHYRGWTIKGMPPPSSGGLTVLQMLGMLERFPLGDAAHGFGFGSPKTLHVMIEAMRRCGWPSPTARCGSGTTTPSGCPPGACWMPDISTAVQHASGQTAAWRHLEPATLRPGTTLPVSRSCRASGKKARTPRISRSSIAGATWQASPVPLNTPGDRASPCQDTASCSTTN